MSGPTHLQSFEFKADGLFLFFLLYLSFFLFFFLFRATRVAYGSSQARGLQLQLPAYTTAIAMQELSQVCDLPHSSR